VDVSLDQQIATLLDIIMALDRVQALKQAIPGIVDGVICAKLT